MARTTSVFIGVLFALLLPLHVRSEPAEPYTVSIQEGLTPRMSPSEVAGLARSLVASRRRSSGDPEPTVVRLECVDGATFRAAFSDPSLHDSSPIWRVHLSSRTVYVVDDANGEIVAYGVTGGGSEAAPDWNRLEGGK